MAEVAADGVTKRFGDVVAVDSLSLTVADGEFLVLLGPSGCGKTTALRCIAGLDAIDEGELRIGGRVVTRVPAKDRDIAMVFQSYALYPHLSVAKNIESPLIARRVAVDGREPRKLTKAERHERVRAATDTLQLTELLDRKPAALSGGQRQRVALARAIVSRPQVFLMDEPLSNLDAKLRGQTRIELVELHRRLGTTFVYVTHDQVEAMTMADRIAVMEGGRLQQVGRPQDVYAEPRNLFVARFIGSPPMTTVPATVRRRDGDVRLELGPEASLPSPPSAAALPDGAAVIAGVRPEHLVVGAAGERTVAASVTTVEWLGHERHLVCRYGETTLIVRQDVGSPAPAPGDTVHLSAPADAVHVFDPTTTERLT